MPLVLVTSDRFADHSRRPVIPSGSSVPRRCRSSRRGGPAEAAQVVAPRRRRDEDLVRVHDAEHIESIRMARGRAAMLDADTFMSPESDEVARLAAGAVLTAIDHVLDGPPANARVCAWCGRRAITPKPIARWGSACTTTSPSARPGRARAGLSACRDRRLRRASRQRHAVDLLRGSVACSSCRRISFPFYPGTGAAEETGAAMAPAITVNLPLRSRRDRRGLRAGLSRGRRSRRCGVRARTDARVRRLRRARARSAGRHAHDDGRLSAALTRVLLRGR